MIGFNRGDVTTCKISEPDPNYKPEDYEMEDINMVLELDEFIEDCKSGCLIDYDGYGYYSNSKTEHEDLDELRVYPSQITGGIINRDYKYVHWYNR